MTGRRFIRKHRPVLFCLVDKKLEAAVAVVFHQTGDFFGAQDFTCFREHRDGALAFFKVIQPAFCSAVYSIRHACV